ncbi:uncharacterized protein RCO7_14897 [Rhynchosporium graminicola]|uniref:Uncharacterized protein n=1 Tax=Rhynchosporium graminicola TaxID=2792576 RepID=A0A1E1L916_9HELO|nr:uncharacterized protein RCO7_14897 [Rhynchosporium commune]
MSSDIKSKDQAYYSTFLVGATTHDSLQHLSADYSKIPEGEVKKHLGTEIVQDGAWNHYPYLSISLFVWLALRLCGDDLPINSPDFTSTINSAYENTIQKLKNGGKFLDEIIPKNHFIAADILNENAPGLRDLEGNTDVVNASPLVHVFNLED